MGISGPETLLVGLRQDREVRPQGRRRARRQESVDVPRYLEVRQGLVGLDGRPVAAGGFLPPYIPMDATLYLGKDDSWPYKLVLVGRKPSVLFETRRIGPDGRPIGAKSSIEKITPSEITLIYTDVKLNAKLRLEEFAFQAPADRERRRRHRGPRQGPRSGDPDGGSAEEERVRQERRARARPADRHPSPADPTAAPRP